jgi:hypothetical protein
MGWPSSLTYREIAARNVKRSVGILASYGDVETAAALFASDPALADDPEALANAAGNGDETFVTLLLRYQPDLARRIAVVAKTRELTELLFRHGMDPNRSNWLGITRLHDFAGQGAIESAAIFIDHGADLHARDEELRSTPLGYAANSGRTRLAAFLLRRGARPNLPDDPPWATPLAWATRRGHDAIVQLLTDYERSGALPGESVQRFEILTRDLVEAYRSGADDAVQRVMDHFHIERMLTWDRPSQAERVARLRRAVRHKLGQPDAEHASDTLALADAELLIARSEGFENWPELVKHTEEENRSLLPAERKEFPVLRADDEAPRRDCRRG